MDSVTWLPDRNDLISGYGKPATSPHAALLIDMDLFMAFNDVVGHLEGDRALQRIAAELHRISALYSGRIYRAGGAFILVIGQSAIDELLPVAREIQNVVRSLKLPFSHNEVRAKHDKYLTVTVGIAYTDGIEELSIKDLLDKAEDAAHAAKQNRPAGLGYWTSSTNVVVVT